MRQAIRTAVYGMAASSLLTAPLFASEGSAESDEVAQLKAMVNNLQKQVDAMHSEQDTQWLTQERAEQIKGMVQDVLADADTRASLLQSGAAAGYDKGFFIGSTDGNYLLKVSGQLQVRFVYNHQNESPTDDNRYGFEVRRAKLFFAGNVVDPSWLYSLELQASSNGSVTIGENAWVTKDFGNGWKLQMGQFKPMYLHEEAVSSKRLFAVERTLINSQFSAGTVQGVQASYTADQWRAFASFNDGNNSNNTSWSTEDTEFAFTGRFEWLAVGKAWSDADEYDGWRDSETSLLLGLGLAYQRGEYGTPVPAIDNFGLSLDATFRAAGWCVAGEFVYRNLQNDVSGPANLDSSQYGAFLQGGYFFTDDLEGFIQYQWGSLDVSGISDLNILTVGINKSFDKYKLRWQTDFGYGFTTVAAAWANDGAGWRADAPGEDGQIVIRSQFQLLF